MNSEPSFSKIGTVAITMSTATMTVSPPEPQHKLANRMIDLHQRPADRMCLFAVDFSDQQCIDDTAQEFWSETYKDPCE